MLLVLPEQTGYVVGVGDVVTLKCTFEGCDDMTGVHRTWIRRNYPNGNETSEINETRNEFNGRTCIFTSFVIIENVRTSDSGIYFMSLHGRCPIKSEDIRLTVIRSKFYLFKKKIWYQEQTPVLTFIIVVNNICIMSVLTD